MVYRHTNIHRYTDTQAYKRCTDTQEYLQTHKPTDVITNAIDTQSTQTEPPLLHAINNNYVF